MTPTTFSDNSNDETCVEHGYDAATPPSIAIVQAISIIENVDPMDFQTDLGIRLFDQIDPEALDRLITDNGGGSNITVNLTLNDGNEYAVQICDTGEIVVQKAG